MSLRASVGTSVRRGTSSPDREDDRERERSKRLPRRTHEQGDGKKTMQIASVRRSPASRLPRSVEDRHRERLSERAIAMDVLDLHRRVVDEHADREREPPSVITFERLPVT